MAIIMGASFSQITSFTTPKAVSTGIGSELTMTLMGSDRIVQLPVDTSTVTCCPLVGFNCMLREVEGDPCDAPSTKNS